MAPVSGPEGGTDTGTATDSGAGSDSGSTSDGGTSGCPSVPSGTTYYVATAGRDTAAGTSTAPLRTITKALSLAAAGDRVLVGAGTYQEVVTFPRSGAPGKPIVLQGSGDVVIDGGDRVFGWVAANEVGPNVYKRTFSTAPRNMTWNGKYIAMIEPSQKTKTEAFATLNQGPQGWDTYDGPLYRSWDGIEAMFGTYDGVTYVRFAANNDPTNENLTFAPNRGVLNISDQSYITVCGLTLQNGAQGVLLSDNANNVIVHGNTIIGGNDGVRIQKGSYRNTVTNNELTLNYIHSLDPNDSRHWFIWAVFKLTSDWDRVAVNLFRAGSDNVVSGNHIYQHWDGIQDFTDGLVPQTAYSQNLDVSYNHIEHSADDGLEPNGGEVNARWHDNLVHHCNIDFRIKSPTDGPLYIYRNRLMSPSTYDPNGENVGVYTHTGTTTTVFIYHNSLSAYLANYLGNNANVGAPNTWWVNNIISTARFGDFDGTGPGPHFDYNWVGGDVTKQSYMGPHNTLSPGARMWVDGDLEMLPSVAAQGKGVDLSKSWTVDGVTQPALPGMTPGYFSGAAPNLGHKP